MSTSPTTIEISVSPPVATITLNRPDRHNTMTIEMVAELHEALSDLSASAELTVIVLTGAGGAGKPFCPGADLKAMLEKRDRGESMAADRSIYQIPAMLHAAPQLTIAAINGAAAGAGLGWACACDLRVAAQSARFNTAFLER